MIQSRLQSIESEHEELKQHLMKNNALANELTDKFQSLIGEIAPLSTHIMEDGVERFRAVAGKVEFAFIQLR